MSGGCPRDLFPKNMVHCLSTEEPAEIRKKYHHRGGLEHYTFVPINKFDGTFHPLSLHALSHAKNLRQIVYWQHNFCLCDTISSKRILRRTLESHSANMLCVLRLKSNAIHNNCHTEEGSHANSPSDTFNT